MMSVIPILAILSSYLIRSFLPMPSSKSSPGDVNLSLSFDNVLPSTGEIFVIFKSTTREGGIVSLSVGVSTTYSLNQFCKGMYI